MSQPAQMLLRFQLPPDLVPLRVERAVVTVDMNAPMRVFEIFAGEGPDRKVLATSTGPVGLFRFPLRELDRLQPDASGSILLGMAVGNAEALAGEGKASSPWRINDVQLELAGKTLGP
jgi:hypothetical protein